MKTLEQVLEGVTAGGQWKSYVGGLYANGYSVDMSPSHPNSAYAARACSNFPALVRALEDMTVLVRELSGLENSQFDRLTTARAALAEALKD